MTLQASGTITMAQIAAELGISATGLSLNDSRVRTLAARPSGSISMSDFYGKSSSFNFTVTTSNNGGGLYSMSSFFSTYAPIGAQGSISPTDLFGSRLRVVGIRSNNFPAPQGLQVDLYIELADGSWPVSGDSNSWFTTFTLNGVVHYASSADVISNDGPTVYWRWYNAGAVPPGTYSGQIK